MLVILDWIHNMVKRKHGKSKDYHHRTEYSQMYLDSEHLKVHHAVTLSDCFEIPSSLPCLMSCLTPCFSTVCLSFKASLTLFMASFHGIVDCVNGIFDVVHGSLMLFMASLILFMASLMLFMASLMLLMVLVYSCC